MVEEELRETAALRDSALRTMREWAIKNQRVISVRLDSKFLLRFLRFRKFNVPSAIEALERYLVLRKYEHEGKMIYQNFDYKDPPLLKLLDLGIMFPLIERDGEGRRVLLYRPRVYDTFTNNRDDIIRIAGIVLETILENEEDQIRGVVHCADGSGVGFHYLTLYTPQEGVRIAKNAEKLVPMRHKEIHGTLVGPALKFALDWGISLLSEKLRKRIRIHTKLDDATSVNQKLLPLEYGGSIPMKTMIEHFKLELESKREILMSHDRMNVRLEMYSEAVRLGKVSSLKVPIDSQTDDAPKVKTEIKEMSGLSGSFRKLEFD